MKNVKFELNYVVEGGQLEVPTLKKSNYGFLQKLINRIGINLKLAFISKLSLKIVITKTEHICKKEKEKIIHLTSRSLLFLWRTLVATSTNIVHQQNGMLRHSLATLEGE